MADRAALAAFLRPSRGPPAGGRRPSPAAAAGATGRLRREEVAALSDLSADYYGRLEQPRGPHPSGQMLAALARGLRLSRE